MVGYQFFKIPITEVDHPHGGLENVYLDNWWEVSDDDCIYLYALDSKRRDRYKGSPQCNRDRRVCEMKKSRAEDFKEYRKLPAIFIPANVSDYV